MMYNQAPFSALHPETSPAATRSGEEGGQQRCGGTRGAHNGARHQTERELRQHLLERIGCIFILQLLNANGREGRISWPSAATEIKYSRSLLVNDSPAIPSIQV